MSIFLSYQNLIDDFSAIFRRENLVALISFKALKVGLVFLLFAFGSNFVAAQKQTKPTVTDKNKKNSTAKTSAQTSSTDKKGNSKNSSQNTSKSKSSTSKSKQTTAKPADKTTKTNVASKPKTPKPSPQPNPLDEAFRIQTVANISQDVYENEDLEVRRLALNALGNRAGTIVVMEVQTGKILSIVNQEWAVRKAFKPCSTIKLVTGIAGLNERIIDEQGNIRFQTFPMDLTDSLAYSNNSYFQKVGANLGYYKLMNYARKLGLGELTGINIDGEIAGKLPAFKYGTDIYRFYSHGDDFQVTAIQLAVLVSAISNGGKLIVPQVKSAEQSEIKYLRRSETLPILTLQGLIPGMIGAVNFGTAQTAFDSSINIGGKTGSCIEEGSWTGLFASVSPVVNPKYAVVVITRGSEERGKFAASVAGKIYRGLNRLTTISPRENNIAQNPTITVYPKVKPETSAKLDEDKGNDSDETGIFTDLKNLKRKKTKKGIEDGETSKEFGVSPIVIENVQRTPSNSPTNSNETVISPPVPINRNVIRPRIVTVKKENP